MLTRFKAYRGNIAHADFRYDGDLLEVWLAQPENRTKTFEDFSRWLSEVKSENAAEAPDFVARFILSQY